MKERVEYSLVSISTGTYWVEVPDGATDDEREEILRREMKEWDENPSEVFEEKSGSYLTEYEPVELDWTGEVDG